MSSSQICMGIIAFPLCSLPSGGSWLEGPGRQQGEQAKVPMYLM